MKDPPEGSDTNSDLIHWFHSEKDFRKVPDQVLKAIRECAKVFDNPGNFMQIGIFTQDISFVFHQKSHDGIISIRKEAKEEQEEEEWKEGQEEEEEEKTEEKENKRRRKRCRVEANIEETVITLSDEE